jgi:hypothetical protein
MRQTFFDQSLTKKIDTILHLTSSIIGMIGGFLVMFGDDVKIAVAVLALVAGIINLIAGVLFTEDVGGNQQQQKQLKVAPKPAMGFFGYLW